MIDGRAPAGGEKNFFAHERLVTICAFSPNLIKARTVARDPNNLPRGQDANTFAFINDSEPLAKLRRVTRQNARVGNESDFRAKPGVSQRKFQADRSRTDHRERLR